MNRVVCFGLCAIACQVAYPDSLDWGGGFVGGLLGTSRTTTDTVFNYPLQTPPISLYYTSGRLGNGNFGGIYGGYNYYIDNKLVLGVDWDVNKGSLSNSGTRYTNLGTTYPSITGSAEMNWFSSLRLRLGYSMDRFLPYVTAGLAVAQVKFAYDWTNPVVTGSGNETGNKTAKGWTLGTGVNYALTDRWIVNAEYRHTRYSTLNATLERRAVGGDVASSPASLRMNADIVNFGITYKF